jgi:hypothetical protein
MAFVQFSDAQVEREARQEHYKEGQRQQILKVNIFTL